MKVLHFYKTYLPDTVGGVEQVINQLIRGTDALGYESEVLVLSPSKVDRVVWVDGHKVYRCKSHFELASTPLSLSVFYHFWRLIKKADIVHYHFPYPLADAMHLLMGHKKPSIVSYHSDIVKQKHLLRLYRPLKKQFLQQVSHIVAASPNYLESSKVLSRFKTKVSVIPYGLDRNLYSRPTSEKKQEWREKVGSQFFLFLGVLRYYKGLHVLIEAAQSVAYPVVIVGSGPIEIELKEQASRLGGKNVYFTGFVDDEDKVALLELCYAIVFPSHLRSEAFGISLLEGAMYGKPLISSEIGTGTTYINIDKETGLVVPPSDPVALRHAMGYLWDNPMLASEMGIRAEERFSKIFTASKMAESYAAIYEKLLRTNE